MDGMQLLTILLAVATMVLIIYTVAILTVVLKLVLSLRRMLGEADQVLAQSKEIVGDVYGQVKATASPIAMMGAIYKAVKKRRAS